MQDMPEEGVESMMPAQKNIDKGWWWDRTWSPLAMRCEKISEGCRSCWHLRFADRMKMNPKFHVEHRKAYAGDCEPIMTDRLYEPIKWKNPQVVAVQLMGDLFHKSVSMEQILSVFSIMSRCEQHTFIVLTKRPERMLEFCEHWGLMPMVPGGPTGSGERWPANVIAMTTVENQEMANLRIPILSRIPASVVGISVEPMLSKIDMNTLTGNFTDYPAINARIFHRHIDVLDFVICGGETGPGARPMQIEWARSLRDQCLNANIPFFFKGFGDFHLTTEYRDGMVFMAKGKDIHNFRLLDGQEHNGFPEISNGL